MDQAKRLTPHEQKLVAAVMAGCNNREIALQCGTREQTVKNQLSTVFHKLGVSSRLQLALLMSRPAGEKDLPEIRLNST